MDSPVAADDVATERVEPVDAEHDARPAEWVGALERHIDGEVEHDVVVLVGFVCHLREPSVRALSINQ